MKLRTCPDKKVITYIEHVLTIVIWQQFISHLRWSASGPVQDRSSAKEEDGRRLAGRRREKKRRDRGRQRRRRRKGRRRGRKRKTGIGKRNKLEKTKN